MPSYVSGHLLQGTNLMDLANKRDVACSLIAICIFGLLACPQGGKSDEPSAKVSSTDRAIAARIAAQYPTSVSISHDGTRVLLRTAKWESDELSVVNAQTGQVIATTESKDTPLSISWSPVGSEIVYFVSEGNGSISHPFLWNLSEHST